MVEQYLAKVWTGVRFPLAAPKENVSPLWWDFFFLGRLRRMRTPSGSTRPVEMRSMFYWGSP